MIERSSIFPLGKKFPHPKNYICILIEVWMVLTVINSLCMHNLFLKNFSKHNRKIRLITSVNVKGGRSSMGSSLSMKYKRSTITQWNLHKAAQMSSQSR